MYNLKKYTRGFTLIELLLVIAILGILITALLVTINPGEAQKKARDLKRMKDLETLQIAVEQYLNDGNNAPSATHSVNSWSAGTGAQNQPCNANWTGLNLCAYLKNVPLDPRNGTYGTISTGGAGYQMMYRLYIYYGGYELATYLESTTNSTKASGDGGGNNSQYELGTRTDLL